MEIRKSVLVPHSAEAMFDLIEGAEHYPAFVPGCRAAQILERSDDIVAARLTLKQAGLAIELETRNPKKRPTMMDVNLTRGPFRHFHGQWRLTPLNDAACRIDFTLMYELDGVAGRVAAPVFARIADQLVDAFVTRAARVLPTAPAAHAAAPGMVPAGHAAPKAPVDVPPPAAGAASRSSFDTAPAAEAPLPSLPTLMPDLPRRTDTMGTQAPDSTLLDTLRASRLAVELTDAQAGRLASVMLLRDLTEGEILVNEGTSDSHLYVLVKGVLGVVKNAGSPDRVTINTLSAGDFVGELSFMDGQQRFASLVALSDARVMGLSRESLESLLEQDPWLVYRVMRAIIRAVHQIQYRLSMQQSELSNYIYKQHGKY